MTAPTLTGANRFAVAAPAVGAEHPRGEPACESAWQASLHSIRATRRPLVVDESLRDGLQSPSVRQPSRDEKLAVLHAAVGIGVDCFSLGLPAAGGRVSDDAVALGREIARERWPVVATAAGRTTTRDVEAIADVSQRAGISIAVYAFIGSSPIRRFVEGWSIELLVARVREAGQRARRASLPFVLVTEDTTRTPPEVLRELFGAAIDAGANGLCLCDTVGHADPHGTRSLVEWTRRLLRELGADDVHVDWHGHSDRGLAVGNALAAVEAGATRVHATALGIGERAGNVDIEHLLLLLEGASLRAPVPPRAMSAYREITGRALRGVAPAAARGGAIDPPASIAYDEPLAPLRLSINGELVETMARPSRTLLELLRYDLGLVGTKQGCDKGDCGACTVIVDGEAVLGCLTLALGCRDREVRTVESLAGVLRGGRALPHPIERSSTEPRSPSAPARCAGAASPTGLDALLDAFDREAAGQCGFCTPGMLMTATALLERDARPSRDAIRRAISGNLCRCTGYGPIVEAIALAAKIRLGEEPGGVDLPGCEAPSPLPSYAKRGAPR